MYSSFFTLILAVAGSVVNALPTADAPALVPRDCSAEVAALNMKRAEKRGLDARSVWPGPQNTTCILAPESPKENYVAGMPARSDIAGGQDGLEFVLDVAVMDVTTCKVLPNTMVELWSPNAMGQYGNFLRGGTTTSSGGIAEFRTIYPGMSKGANHVNIAVHTSSSMSSSTTHVGKLFFVDRWNELILGTSPYTQNSNPKVLDNQDADYRNAVSKGYSPVISITSIHDDWPEGVVGIVTVGVNPH
ncbi:hypothetical protein Agabi119p4_10080 [Agaricus bisporus var. burnettii]|uniref:Intradiol ring-cleavage dioxygenases domain-containing protein n=1 Tax=Agaricus bisporus var. burnettii TaxID=192524 RepID=A0A8H7C2B0_AGABI|nr:hypothetical protein Agabi119p4_10080 [Agaricus bisporus var. burnettii]